MKQIKFLLIYAKNYTGSLVLTVISMLLLVGVQLFIPWIIKTMIGITNLNGEQNVDGLGGTAAGALGVGGLCGPLRFAISAQLYGPCGGLGRRGGCAQADCGISVAFALQFYEDKQTGQLMLTLDQRFG